MTVEEKYKKIAENPIVWIETFMSIRNKEKKIVRMKLNPQQKFLIYNRARGNIILKGRQQGMSTAIMCFMIYLSVTQPGSVCLQMAQDHQTANDLFLKLKEIWELMDDCVKVPTVANNRKEILLTNGSRIQVTSCGKNDRGRGQSYTCLHLSECGLYNEYMANQLAALRSCLLPGGNLFLESTAHGFGVFQDLWTSCTSGFDDSLRPFFFGWVKDQMWVKEQKAFAKDYEKKFGKLTPAEMDDEELVLFNDMDATIIQLEWRRNKIKELGGLDMFHQEFPSTPLEAFINSGSSVFNSEKVLEYAAYAKKVKMKNLPNTAPAIMRKYRNDMCIYRLPEKKMRYHIGVDSASGLGGGDNSVIQILDHTANQVFKFSSNRIKPWELAQLIYEVGTYYNSGNVIVEKASSGEYLTPKLVEMGYYNMYRQRKFNKGGGKRSYGFTTTQTTKSIIVSQFQEGFENDLINVVDSDTLNEMKNFCLDETSGKMEGKGTHDDHVMAIVLAYESLSCGRYYE